MLALSLSPLQSIFFMTLELVESFGNNRIQSLNSNLGEVQKWLFS